ncbi:MAG: hypothetical protein WD603_01620 [Patescibacteria group bacterium]
MRNHLKIFAVVFAFLLAGVAGVGSVAAKEGQMTDPIRTCDHPDGDLVGPKKDPCDDGGKGGSATTSRTVDADSATSRIQQQQPQSQTRFSQEVKPAPEKQRPVAEQKASEATEEPVDAIIAAAEENSASSPWNTVFVALGIASVVLGSLLVHRHVRRQMTDRS